MKKLEIIIALGMLLFAIGLNLWLYRLEPTAMVDPNDNAFQFALVDRTNQIWDFANKTCPKNLSFSICHLAFLVDHWVPNWAEGYNLPYYYSHIPQILIVGSYRLLHSLFAFGYSLFAYYHVIIYLLLSLFPLSMFLALRVLRLPWLTAGIGALLSSHISTDGLYGLDPASFLWRGYGLSSQLFAMIFLPLAITYSWRYFSSIQEADSRASSKNFFPKRSLIPAVFFLVATTAGHLGIGIIAMLSLGVLALTHPILLFLQYQSTKEVLRALQTQLTKLLLVAGATIFFLSYWIIPILLDNNYHNISFWDPVWKFNSYGWKEILTNLFNGNLFDFGRFPILTICAFIGFFSAARGEIFADRFPSSKTDNVQESGPSGQKPYQQDKPASSGARKFFHEQQRDFLAFSFLFAFWLLLYFGRTTWGSLIDLIPGMKEFHLSRFIVGVHMIGLFLAPIGIQWVISLVKSLCERFATFLPTLSIHLLIYVFIGLFVYFTIVPQTIKYAQHNDTLILQANENYAKVKSDIDDLFITLHALPPGRVFAGRGGWWGKDLKVAETPYYMHLSTYGIPTVLWLPETWSMNSDTEQYFTESRAEDYALYNIRYVVAPPTQKPQAFWKLIKETASWKLYEVTNTPQMGYFTTGIRPAIVASDKESFVNVVRLWIQSEYPELGLFPELTFAKDYPKTSGLPNFKMIDEATYQIPARAGEPDGSLHSLFQDPPTYLPPSSSSPLILEGPETGEADMIFKTTVRVEKDCPECLVILKQTSHPNWRVTVDGKPAATLTVFPFYLATRLTQVGTHDVIFAYQPSKLKVLLLIIEGVTVIILLGIFLGKRKTTHTST